MAKTSPGPHVTGNILKDFGFGPLLWENGKGRTGLPAPKPWSRDDVTFQLRVHERDSLSDGFFYSEIAGI